MAFLTLFLCGVVGGLLGGMGMGGGTALIPLLTLFGVPQAAAQGVNLLSFLPTAAIALSIHAKNGLIRREGLLLFILPALACSVPARCSRPFCPLPCLSARSALFSSSLPCFA